MRFCSPRSAWQLDTCWPTPSPTARWQPEGLGPGQETLQVLAWLAVPGLLLAVALLAQRDDAGRATRLRHQIAAQLVLLTGVEVFEVASTATSSAVVPSLHDPAVWLGTACQVVAAVAIRRVTGRAARALATCWSPPVLSRPPAVARVGISNEAGGATRSTLPRPIMERAPPASTGPLPLRS